MPASRPASYAWAMGSPRGADGVVYAGQAGFGRVRAARRRRGDQGRAGRRVARRKLAEDRGIDQLVARHLSVDNMLAR
jgi:hypothetical protein